MNGRFSTRRVSAGIAGVSLFATAIVLVVLVVLPALEVLFAGRVTGPVQSDSSRRLPFNPLLELNDEAVRPLDCGPNCLFVLMKGLGIDCSREQVIEDCQVAEKGCSLDQLSVVAASYGFDCVPVKASLKKSIAMAPCILHVEEMGLDQGHFILALGRDSDRVLAVDGTTGQVMSIGEGQLARVFSGYALVPEGNVDSSLSWVWIVGLVVLGGVALYVMLVDRGN